MEESKCLLGKYNTLKVVKILDFGAYLDGYQFGEILLPKRYIPEGLQVDDELTVFIYLDSEDRVIATTEKPFAQVGEVALLRVKSTNAVGAFLDWGLMKDLLVPFREQKTKMDEERSYVVFVHIDEDSNRIVASAKLEKFMDNTLPKYEYNQEVDLILYNQTELGYKAIINNLHTGIIYHSEVFRELNKGERCKGFIKKVREDGKIDLSLQKLGYEKVGDLSDQILEKLFAAGGFLPYTDKSSLEEIEEAFACSKKSFKKAIGKLYKDRKIVLEERGIRLIIEPV